MNRFSWIAAWLVLLCTPWLALSASAQATAQSGPPQAASVRLSAFKVTTSMVNGVATERLEKLDGIKPGEVIEYQAVYRNSTPGVQANVMVSLPVPVGGLQYLPNTAAPEKAEASLDGVGFAALPLTVPQTLTDGRKTTRLVPPDQYRALRWALGDVPAGASRTVRARMLLPLGTGIALLATPSSAAR
jgi:hypothetical protein